MELRPLLNRTYQMMLQRYGLYSSIVDVLDNDMVSMVRGGMQNMVNLIYRTMDGEDIDLSSLSQEEINYVKTAKVLMGETLYSDAWLES